MEWLKVGCKTFIRPFRDRPDVRCPIRYVRVPMTNPTFTLETIFGFNEYDKDGLDPVYPGVEFDYRWATSALSLFPAGSSFCGTADQWLHGCLSTDPLPPVDPATGRFVCCGGATLMIQGGEAHGGQLLIPGLGRAALGGEAHGGRAVRIGLVAALGGEAHAGELRRAQWLVSVGDGGEAHGGELSPGALTLAFGGEAHGGAATYFGFQIRGGEAHGGGPGIVPIPHQPPVAEVYGGISTPVFHGRLPGGTGEGGRAALVSASVPLGGEAHGGGATPSQPSVTVVQSTGLASTAGGQAQVQTPLTPAPVTLGNKLVVLVWTYNTSDDDPSTYTVTDNLGNVYTVDIRNTLVASPCAVFSAPITHAGGTVQVTVQLPGGHTGYLNAVAVEIAGVPSNVTEAAAQGGSAGAVSTIQTPPISTTHPGCILFSAINTSSGMTAVTHPPGWTQIAAELSGNVHEDGAAAYLILTGTVAGQQYTWSWDTVSGVNDVVVAYRPG